MSLAAGPGRGGVANSQLPDELKLVVDKHVAYIQSLDTVCSPPTTHDISLLRALTTNANSSAATSSSTISQNTSASAASIGA